MYIDMSICIRMCIYVYLGAVEGLDKPKYTHILILFSR